MFYRYIPTQARFDSLTNVSISSFAYTELQNEPSLLHSHINCEIMVPISGGGYLLVNGNKIPLKEGQIVVINSNVMHTEKNETGSLKYYSLRLTTELPRGKGDAFIMRDVPEYEELKSYLDRSLAYLETEENEPLGILNLSAFFYCLKMALERNGYHLKNSISQRIPTYVLSAKEYINKHYGQDFKIEDLASSLDVSTAMLLSQFKKYVGVTPKEYLVNVRVETAISLLRTTDYQIGQVAALCGFCTPAYFAKTMKERTGKSPKQIRNPQ